VRAGDTLSSIARRYGVQVSDLRAANGLRNSSTIHPGDTLKVPGVAATASTEGEVAAARTDITAQLPERLPGGVAALAVTPAKSKAKPSAPKVHVVRSGDTLWAVSKRYGVSVPALAAANGLGPNAELSIGTRLEIPSGGASGSRESTRLTYEVRSGDTLTRIADRFNVSVRELAEWNNMKKSQTLRTGQRLVVYSDPQRVDGG
jgi:membrane-bound lytic murein transglycosylase D